MLTKLDMYTCRVNTLSTNSIMTINKNFNTMVYKCRQKKIRLRQKQINLSLNNRQLTPDI